MDNELATKDLLDVKKIFDSQGIPIILLYGTCLGAYRDGDYLPGDHDIDLGVVEKLTYKQRKDVGWMLYDIGFILQPDITFSVFDKFEYPEIGYNGDEKTGIIVCQRNVPISVLFFYEEKDNMICIPKFGGVPIMSSPLKFYKDMKELKFKGEKFLIPSPVEDYLAFTYFNNWKDKTDRRHAQTYQEMYERT